MRSAPRPFWLIAAVLLGACGPASSPARPGPASPEVVSIPPPTTDSPPEVASEPAEPVAVAPPADPASPLGRSKERAIEVCRPLGERDYLARLRCPDGRTPAFARHGNVGPRNAPKPGTSDQDRLEQMNPNRQLRPGEIDSHIIDVYEVTCSDKVHEIFMDMYHCVGPQTSDPPSGFTTVREGDI